MKIDLKHYQRIDSLIRSKSTGNPGILASKLGISKRQTLKILKDMKERFSAPIKYNYSRETYIYTEEGFFEFGFQKSKVEAVTQAVLTALQNSL